MNKSISFIILCIFFISCNNYRKEIEEWEEGQLFVPLQIVNTETNDTATIITYRNNLYYHLNMKIVDYKYFSSAFERFISEEKSLIVSQETFLSLKEYQEIKKDATVDSIYSKGGIETVLSCYLSPAYGGRELFLDHPNPLFRKYIIYLCFLHKIRFRMGWENEYPPEIYLLKESLNKELLEKIKLK